jgi:SAM-dependent methyltransferase
MDLKELDLVDPERHWYYQAKLFAIKKNLDKLTTHPKRVIDVGAGSGFFAKSICNFSQGDVAECIDPNYDLSESYFEPEIRFLKKPNVKSLPNADIFLFIDVLEHVDDDLGLLKSYLETAKSGAKVIITVPAFMGLWSYHDEFLQHHRRYKLAEVLKLCRESSLNVVHKQYLFGLIFPMVWIFRKLNFNREKKSDMRQLPDFLNKILLFIEKIEHSIGWNKFFGLSVLVVAEVE